MTHTSSDLAGGGALRRLVAILVADVVGYSRLMGADEEATLSALRALRTAVIDPALTKHHGRLVKTTGDGLLVEFTSVVDALRCGIAWQQGVARANVDIAQDRRVVFRIGINLGDVIVEDGDIHGDGVNVAARLESLARPGTICISRAARDQVRDKLPVQFESLGALHVKNIARPVQAFLVTPGADLRAGTLPGGWMRSRLGLSLAVAAFAVMTASGALVWLAPWATVAERDAVEVRLHGSALPLPDLPSIAVLPFDNLGADVQDHRLGEALAENIISSLSKLPQMFVIARNSTFTYKGQAAMVQKVSKELGVRYVLEGSVQQAGAKVRINAQLIDAMSGFHLWSETYDREIDDIFALQDDITLNVVTALQIELTQGEVARIRQRGTHNLRAWLLVNQSFEHLMRFTKQDNAQARKLAEEAVELDPNYPEAYVRLARTYLIEFHSGWTANPDAALRRSIELAQHARKLDDAYPDTYHLLSAIYLFVNRHDDAMLAVKKALDLSPSHSLSKANMGMILTYSGEAEAAIPVLKEAMRLSPIYPDWFLSELARAYFQTGRFEDAVQVLKRHLENDPRSGEALILLAAAQSSAGRLSDAKAALAKFLEPRPAYTLRLYARGEFYKNPEDLDRVLDALRKVGLPE